jgi:hypothetical protein
MVENEIRVIHLNDKRIHIMHIDLFDQHHLYGLFFACSENSPRMEKVKDCNLTAQEIRSIRYIVLIDFNLQISHTN